MMKIKTLPVYSKLADESEVRALGLWEKLPQNPDGSRWQLSQHQVETYKALTQGDADVIFNTAMTGDGKSLAAYLPVLENKNYHTFGMYPTNELARDQERQFENYARQFKTQILYDALWGAKLGEFAKSAKYANRGQALKEKFSNNSVILTNPDIFHLVMNYRYDRLLIFTEQELPYTLDVQFDAFVFDEFHIFSMPQIISAITAMLYMKETGESKHKFLFSSATPDPILLGMVNRSGLTTKVVEGNYINTGQPGYRPVLHPINLEIHSLGEQQSAEDWVSDHISQLVTFWREQSPRPKGAIIVNSVVAARRIFNLLREQLEKPHQITVGEITGLTMFDQRQDARLNKDIVVGTSTIDVGVDFSINLLIFESVNAGTFIQRFGRLGRYRMDGSTFQRYEAHALLSGKMPGLEARLSENLQKVGLQEGEPVQRSLLNSAVLESFRPENDFYQYARRWGALQVAHVAEKLKNTKVFEKELENFKQRAINTLELKNFGRSIGYYWALAKSKENQPVLDEVLAFRGSSPFLVAVWDKSVTPNAFLSYDLFSLLQNADYTPIFLDEYEDAMRQYCNTDEKRQIAKRSLENVMVGAGDKPLILKITSFKKERDYLKLRIGWRLSQWTGCVVVASGLVVDEPSSSHLKDVNKVLMKQKVVTYVCDSKYQPLDLRRMLHLPAHFPLFICLDQSGKPYTVAFGKHALMLESQILQKRNRNVEDEPIVC